jgi:hypothetical protein
MDERIRRFHAVTRSFDTFCYRHLQFYDHVCRGSSLVERRPEKAGVASSILAPGTIVIATLASKFHVLEATVGSPPCQSNELAILPDKLLLLSRQADHPPTLSPMLEYSGSAWKFPRTRRVARG